MSLKGVFAIVFAMLLVGCGRIELPFSDGSVKALSEYEGKWLFINYWAIWCKPCIEEIPELNALAEHENIDVIGYNFDKKQGAVLQTESDKLNIQFPLLGTDPAPLFEQDRPSALPATMLIAPDGTFVRWLLGPQTQESLLRVVESQIKK